MHIRPDGKGNTVYTAYFFATEEGQWRLVASFLRPKTNTWHTRPHSFLENFSPEQGYGVRLDYQGGLLTDKSAFYLKMGGFFNGSAPLRSKFERTSTGTKPEITFEELEEL